MKMKYELPELDVICLKEEDVIVTSGNDGGEIEIPNSLSLW